MGLSEITGSFMGRDPKPDPHKQQSSRMEEIEERPEQSVALEEPVSPARFTQPLQPLVETCLRTPDCPKKNKHIGACAGTDTSAAQAGRSYHSKRQSRVEAPSTVEVDITKLRTATGTMAGEKPHTEDSRICVLALIHKLEGENEDNLRLIALLRKRL